jgi:hypothetical protein
MQVDPAVALAGDAAADDIDESMTRPPLRRSSWTATRVSKVSPDWDTAMYNVSGSTTGLR